MAGRSRYPRTARWWPSGLGNDGNGIDSGHVRLYAWDGSSWVQRGSDIDGEAADDLSGSRSRYQRTARWWPSGLMATTVMASIQAMCGSMLGMVRAWVQRGSDIDGEAADDYSGSSVSLSADGSMVAIGAYRNDGNGSDCRPCAALCLGWFELGAARV